MKKLNNKGMTSVEVLMSFVVVVMITISMYTVVSAYQNKQQVESFKEKIMTYKNLLTKEVNDDLIKKGLVSVDVKQEQTEILTVDLNGNGVYDEPFDSNNNGIYDEPCDEKVVISIRHIITFTLKNGQQKRMTVTSTKASESGAGVSGADDRDDEFIIAYGDIGNEMEYPLPNVGYTKNDSDKKVYDLRFNTVDVSTYDGVFSLFITLVHPELENKYNISIISPINF